MAKQVINVGTSANDGTGDKIRVAFQKSNANFTELYDTKIESVVAGTNVTVDNTDPLNPIVSASGAGGGVPYTGATQDVNLGEFGLLTGNIEFDNTPTNIPTTAGSMVWNDTDGTLDLKLKGGNVTLQIGQEQVLRVVNKTATNINLLEANYQAVRVTGAQGQRLKVDLAQATNDLLSAETIGLVTETINDNQEGFITTSGLIRGVNTTGSLQSETWADGDILYLSPTVAGQVTKVKPVAPNHLVIIGYVVSAHATQGSIFVKVDNGYELDELHNVKIATPLNNNILTYTSATEIWENKTVATALGFTPANDSAVVHNTGDETIAGIKTFSSNIVMPSTGTPLILKVESSGQISGLPLANYPSVDELAFVKGVTSSIQTQLDGKLTSAGWVDISLTSTIVGWSSFTLRDIQYLIMGNICHVRGIISGTSNSTTTSFTMPFSYTGTSSFGLLGVSVVDNGAILTTPGLVRILTNTNNMLFFKDGGLTNFTASGTKQVNFSFSFKIN